VARRRVALDLAHQPRLHARAVLDRQLVAGRSIGQVKACLRSEIGDPVGLQLYEDGGDNGSRERPIQVLRVEAVDNVAQPHRNAARQARDRVRHAQGREGVARVGHDRRTQICGG
jgi:hypothetical protein